LYLIMFNEFLYNTIYFYFLSSTWLRYNMKVPLQLLRAIKTIRSIILTRSNTIRLHHIYRTEGLFFMRRLRRPRGSNGQFSASVTRAIYAGKINYFRRNENVDHVIVYHRSHSRGTTSYTKIKIKVLIK